MSTRAAGIIMVVLAFSASGAMLNQSGMAGVLGNQCSTAEFGDQVGTIDIPEIGQDSIALTMLTGITDFIILGPFERALRCIGFPEWFTWPVVNAIARPLYALALYQLGRGVVIE